MYEDKGKTVYLAQSRGDFLQWVARFRAEPPCFLEDPLTIEQSGYESTNRDPSLVYILATGILLRPAVVIPLHKTALDMISRQMFITS